MAYIPPHLRNDLTHSREGEIPEQPPLYRSPQPQRRQNNSYRSETPSFSRGKSRLNQRDRWEDYRDSRLSPLRAQKREKWLNDTKEERDKMNDDPTQAYENLEVEITGNNVPTEKINSF